MRVLHILDWLSRGGVEVLELDVCRNARANGLELTFVATGGGDLEDDFRLSGAEFIRLQRRFPLDASLILQLRKIIKERGIQVVHSHQAVEGLHAYFATVGTQTKRVLSFHGGIVLDAKNRHTLRFLIPRVDANVAVGIDFLNYLRAEGGFHTNGNFVVILNGVDPRRLQSANRKLRAELDLSDEDLLFGMVANFYSEPRKDQMTVCRALPALFTRAPKIHFAFVGGFSTPTPQMYTDCVSYCRQHGISDRVHFLGRRSNIADVLGSLDVFVFSSLHEGLPIAVIEALMVGIPTVVSDIGPMLEVSDNGAYAQVFRAKDSDDLADKLIQLAEDPERRRQLGAKAKQWATQRFGIETYISNLIDLYSKLAHSKRDGTNTVINPANCKPHVDAHD
jgi:glycosyltransferase involved in cell wall biosynthesis